jgi:hypothetical protein
MISCLALRHCWAFLDFITQTTISVLVIIDFVYIIRSHILYLLPDVLGL